MKQILRWLLPVAIALIAAGCSKERLDEHRYEFDAEWAAAYYYGTDAAGGVNCFQLDLAQGRTDADLDLISTGAVVRLLISAPVADEIALPDGLYLGSDSREDAYTFNCGTKLRDNTVSGSYVGLRPGGEKQTLVLPVDNGKVSVRLSGDDLYEVSAELRTGSKTFFFIYRGTIHTFDCTEPQQ
jgi:hypothetical protein